MFADVCFTCVLVSSGVGAVDVVGLVDNWDGVGRDVDGDVLVDRGMVDRDGVGWLVVVDGGGVGGQLLDMVVGAGVLRGGGAGLVRPGVVGEPGGGGHVLQVRLLVSLRMAVRRVIGQRWYNWNIVDYKPGRLKEGGQHNTSELQ